VKECANVLTEYENLLTELGNIRMPEFNVTREAYFTTEPLVLTPEHKTMTHYCVNPTLQSNLFVFQDRTNNSTEFVKIPPSGDFIESVSSFPAIFNHVTQHQDRLICDNYVYWLQDFSRI
jgi:hypothetical protein